MNQTEFDQAKGFIYADIQREIDIAHTGKDAGNFLCAVALLCYTEFSGGILRRKFQRGEAGRNFNTFFDTLGPDYENFRKQHDVYSIFRCGLAHEYYVKRSCQIAMLKGDEQIGIGISPEGIYYFLVERYFEDFRRALDQLTL